MCWADTLVHPIEAEDNAIALIRFESGAIGQFEVSWTFRGGMDLRDEVAGTEGTIWTNHFLRTGFEMFSSGEGGGYVAEKAETASGWLFPSATRCPSSDTSTCSGTCSTPSTKAGSRWRRSTTGTSSTRSWTPATGRRRAMPGSPSTLADWRGAGVEPITRSRRTHDGKLVIKEEKMPDGRRKLILKDEQTGEFADVVVAS